MEFRNSTRLYSRAPEVLRFSGGRAALQGRVKEQVKTVRFSAGAGPIAVPGNAEESEHSKAVRAKPRRTGFSVPLVINSATDTMIVKARLPN